MYSLHALKLPAIGLFCFALIAGCGGGHKSPPPAPPTPLAPQSIAFATVGPIAKQFGDAPFTNAASGGSGTGAISYVSATPGVATVDSTSGLVTIVGAGTTQITANKASDSRFLAAQATYILNVAPAAQAIAFANVGPINTTFGAAPFTNAASGGAGSGSIGYSSSDISVATVNSSTGLVTVVSAGTAVITAVKVADTNHLAAQASYTLNVALAVQTIAFQNAGPVNVPFGTAPFTNSLSASPGTGAVTFASGNLSVATVDPTSGVVTIVGVGTAQMTATKAADGRYAAAQASYTLNVSRAAQTIAFVNAGPVNATYGSASFTNGVSGGVGTGNVTFASDNLAVATVNSTSGAVTIVGAGTAQITAIKAADANYLAAQAQYTLNVAKAAQTIVFNTSGTIVKRIGDPPFVNSATGGAGTGAITYASSNTSVGLVNATTGNVTIGSPGVATLTATKAASANHLAAQASYALRVTTLVPMEPFTAWIGSADSQVTLPTLATGADFIRAFFANCTTLVPSSCSSSTTSTVVATTLTETTARLDVPAQYWLQRGAVLSQPTIVATARYMPVEGQDPIVFNDQLWLVDGNYGGSTWSSVDGRAWVRRSVTPTFGDREGSQVVAHNNRLWSIGGMRFGVSNAGTSDVWSSVDGVNWTIATASADFGPRTNHQVVVMNGKMWLVSGENAGGAGNTQYNDVWSSVDGVTWTLATAATPFVARRGFELTAFNGRLWVMGGINGNNYPYTTLRDVWSSQDGVTWRAETQLPVSARHDLRALVDGNRLYIMGGSDDTEILGDVWYTEDGLTWTEAAASTKVGPRMQQAMVAFRDRIFLIGGWNNIRGQQDVWTSTDWVNWQYEDPVGPYDAMYNQTLIEFNGRLWAVGRGSNEAMHAASTVDGDTWTESPGVTAIPTRHGSAVAVFNNRLWIMGGMDPNGSGSPIYLNDLWSTADGLTWTQSPEPPFLGRSAAQMFALNGRMFVLGGTGYSPNATEVWSTDDGLTWRQDLASAPFGARTAHQVEVFNGRAWLFGGEMQAADAWSSADGVNWIQETLNDTSVATRFDHQMFAFNNRLWLLGGVRRTNVTTYTAFNDVWSSANGTTWTRETANATWSPRQGQAVTAFGGKVWLFGGEWLYSNGSNREVWQSSDAISWRLHYRNYIEVP